MNLEGGGWNAEVGRRKSECGRRNYAIADLGILGFEIPPKPRNPQPATRNP